MVDGLVFEQYAFEYGLSSTEIKSYLKDSKGFIWLGTPNGLNVLDGKGVKYFKGYLNKGNKFRGRAVQLIFEDTKGRVFVGMHNYGINVFDRAKALQYNIDDKLLKDAESKDLISLLETSPSHYVLLTNSELIYFQLNEEDQVHQVSIVPFELVQNERSRQLLIYKDTLYINTNRRLVQVKKSGFREIFKHRHLHYGKVHNDRLWISVDTLLGVFSEDLSKINYIDYHLQQDSSKGKNYYRDFDLMGDTELWLGSRHQLINLKLNEEFDVVYSKEYTTKVPCRRIDIDPIGNVYITTDQGQGLVKLNGRQQQYSYIKLPEGFENSHVYNFTQDIQGWYWSGGAEGVFAYDPVKEAFIRFANGSYNGLEGRKVNGQIVGEDGQLWFGTSNGIAQYNALTNDFEFYGHDDKDYWKSFTHHLDTDADHNLWYLSANRLNVLDASTKEHRFMDIQRLQAILIDPDNFLWAYIDTKGLVKYQFQDRMPVEVETFDINQDLMRFIVHGINLDQFGRFWISGQNGIYIYDLEKKEMVYHINRNNLLYHESLYGITPDNRGNFWVGQYGRQALCISSETFEIVDSSPVWMRRESNTELYSGPSSIGRDGKIFSQGEGGYYVYQPEQQSFDPTPPQVVLASVILNGESEFEAYLGSDQLIYDDLRFDQNNFRVRLKSVNEEKTYFTNYAYRLLGNTEEWQYVKELGDLSFNGLPPANYKLQVKATSNGEFWSTPVSLLEFKILPPWWKTELAFFCYGLFVLGIGYTLYRFQLNKRLAEAETIKLKEVDEFKNTFYQNITHEFRTPLTVIKGMSESLDSEPSVVIQRNADQLLKLVNELLEVGKLESKSAQLQQSRQDLVQFVRYSIESLESLAASKEIRLFFESNTESFETLFDPDKMQLVLNNLISNAIKFTPAAGNIEVQTVVDDKEILIQVKDSGPGIPEKDLDRVFDRYYRSEAMSSNPGTGIGLALSRELIRLMDGQLTASNKLEGGACFSIHLPVIAFDQKEKVQEVTLASNQEKNLILLIEDNGDVRNYISSVLEGSYRVETALNGKQGYERAVELIPDLIISDVMMPIMDGYEACDLIKSDFKTSHIPVILLTAKADLESKISGIKRGADVYLAKPFNREELLTHIQNQIVLRERLKAKYSQQLAESDEVITVNTDPFVSQATDLVLSRLSDAGFGIEEMCRELGVSRTQLHRKLTALTGLSTSIFIREIRLREGLKNLKQSQLSVSEVAYAVGFNDPSYFSKLFTEKFNISPSKVERNT